MKQDENIQTLTSLGLSLLQAKVYLAMVTSAQPLTTKTISTTANIARQEVYRIAYELQEKALVEKILKNPNAYKAMPLHEAIEMLYQRKQKENEEAHIRAIQMSKKIQDSLNLKLASAADNNQFVIIPGMEPHRHRIQFAIENAQMSLDSLISWKSIESAILGGFTSQRIALQNGVRIRYIAEMSRNENELHKILKPWNVDGFDIRFVSCLPSTYFGIVDKREIFTVTEPKDIATRTCCLWSNSSGFIEVFQKYFDSKWNEAKSISL